MKVCKKLYEEKNEVLYEILLIYFSNILNPIEQNTDFFVKFFTYAASKKEFQIFENGLNYIKDIETFVVVIDKTKEKIIDRYVIPNDSFKPIKLKANLGLIKKEKNKEMKVIISAIESIIKEKYKKDKKEKKVLLVYFTSNFWIKILNDYNVPDEENIENCYKLRKLFFKYNYLVNDFFKNDKKSEIKKDINNYFERDEFAFLLDKNIKKFIEDSKENKEISNAETLGLIEAYNPYYKEDKYIDKRDPYIFDYINIDDKNEQFIETFKKLEFEKMFKDNIIEFLIRMISKIKSISNFGTVLELINIKKISKVNEFYNLLKDKYENVIKIQIDSLTGEQLDEAIKIISKFVDIIFLHEKNCNFIEQKINKLDKNISHLIYNELIKRCKGEIYKPMKELIYQKFLNKLDNIDNIIILIDSLGKQDKKIFLEELMKKCLFTKEEFYSNCENSKIFLLCELNEKEKLQLTDEDINYGDIERIITQIRKDLEGEIGIKKLEEFLDIKKDTLLKRLGLLKLILRDFKPEQKYIELKKKMDQIKIDIKELVSIKNSLLIFHRNRHQNDINDISIIIKELQEKNLNFYNSEKTKEIIQKLKQFNNIVEQIKIVKDFILFKVLFDEAYGNDQEKRFKEAIKKLDDIKDLFEKNASAEEIYKENKDVFDKIKEMISNNESKANIFFEQMTKYFKLEEKKQLNKDLTLIIKSKKYEMDLKSIIYFFESLNFEKDDNKDKWNEKISKKYAKLSEMNLEELKKNLKELKDNGIYDYDHDYDEKNIYIKIFTSLYEKKEAIDFLLSKANQDISGLYDRIDPTNKAITINNIQDTEECIKIFNELKELKDNSKIFEFIKTKLNKDQISKFEIYSKNYISIIELDRNDDSSLNLYKQVNSYIRFATFIFRQDTEDFFYSGREKTTMEELVHLKNKIHIKPPKETKDSKDEYQNKCYQIIFFKNIISNLEDIYEYIKVLRTKGSSLPILISLHINYPEIKYFLNGKKTDFENIRDFLFLAKTDYISQLDSIYKQKKYLRFLYGKLFRNIMRHLDGGFDVLDILKFILNNKENKEIIKDGKAANPLKAEDYVQYYNIYNENSFDNISNYLTSLFENNGTSLQKHYESMLIKEKNKYKGIYLHKCVDESMEEFILNIFKNKIGQLPIAQNVLISSKETSQEEMQAFFYRAILCDYNTLFVVEINDSFSDFKQNIMYTYIDALLSYQNEIYKELEKKNVDKSKAKEYLNSCIIFVYEENDKENTFLTEIKRFEREENEYKLYYKKDGDKNSSFIDQKEQNIDDSSNRSLLFSFEKVLLENIKVITSDVCGLGKSYKIKKMIEKEKKKYFHFPLGGIITKSIIFEKLTRLLKKISNENENNFQNVAIHLDLTESKETSIINEFLFSFLITKFYNNNENIIYIPKDMEIFIEIPNCFENYLSKFGILNAFTRENITLENIPKLDLPQNILEIFKNLIEFDSENEIELNGEIEKFIKPLIGIEKYSYNQLIIFIKLFIYQYSKLTKKLTFKKGVIDNSETYIKEFAECTQYFTNRGFTELLMRKNEENEKKDYIDLLSDIYESDLNRIKIDIPLIFISKEKKTVHKIIIPERSSTEYQGIKNYLQKMKEILELPNEVEKNVGDKKSLLSILDYQSENYVITNDNFKKMILLVYRIKANIPVIIMGETGCGKTSLIKKLNQILNNGEISVQIINIHPGITDEDICIKMKEINEKAKKNKKNEIWIFFDEINTCLSLSLLTEIFNNRTYNGEPLSENIRLIGACNPYRKRKANTEKCGLSRDDDNENELVYLVQRLPQSLLYYVFSFGSINEEDEKKYIYSIIEKLFTKDEKKLHEATRDAIFECHKLLRETFDPSVVSLREISRFSRCVEFFQNYYTIKNEYQNDNNENNNEKINNKESKEKLFKIKSIICSIYLCYFIRLTDEKKRNSFDIRLREILLKLVNTGEAGNEIKEEAKDSEKKDNLLEQIKYEKLKKDLKEESLNQFSDLLKIEEDFLLDKIELDKGIGKNNLLKENVFLLFLAVITKIPLIIVGKPGTGKTLSAQLIYKSMRGKYSKNKFFRKYPQIIQTYFQGSESTKPEDVEKLFEIAGSKLKFYIEKNIKKEEMPISMILFDELGLAEKSESNPLKVLHSKLEYTGKEEGVSFIGISNYSLDAAKVNRALNLSLPNLEDRIDQLIDTSKSIVKSISEDLSKNSIFEILSKAYYEYKNILNIIKELTALKQFESKNLDSKEPIDLKNQQYSEIKNKKEFINILKKEKTIKIDFHGNRDLYNFIKGTAREMARLNELDDNELVNIVEKYIERNFGGIDYEIDIDLDLKLSDIEDKIKLVNEILKEFTIKKTSKKKNDKKNEKENNEKEKIKVTSVFLFKKIYNIICDREVAKSFKINNNRTIRYDLNSCINDNINDINNRYLLLEIKPSLQSLVFQNIIIQNREKNIYFYEGSPFVDDNNNEYRFKQINEIQDDAKTDKLIILQNLNQIQPFLYDLYNMNYIIKDQQKFARICLDNFSVQLTPVNDSFRIIILVDKKFINEVDVAFLNRLEKMKISFEKLLDNEQVNLTRNIIEEINFKYNIEKCQKQINYVLKNLLINCGKEEIQGLIYNNFIESKMKNNYKIDKNDVKEKINNKISKMLPQDIICILPNNHNIKKIYIEEKKYCNLKEYINDEENKKYKISIIYSFNNIANIIYGINNEMSFMVSEIKSENQLKNIINEIKNKNENNKYEKSYNILIHFEQFNSNKIQFISNFIIKNFKYDKYNYIFIIHIKRNFDSQKEERIYSIPDINPDINQLFIDNLNGLDIKLKDLLDKNIYEILDVNDRLMDLDKEFNRTLSSFVYKALNEKNNSLNSFNNEININEENYIDEIQKYMDEEVDFKEKIIEKAKNLINDNIEIEGDFRSLLDKILKMNYIGKNNIDIISYILDYIKEQIFNKYLKHIFEVLEDNNILTTLLEIKSNKNNKLEESIIEELRDHYLDIITMENKIYEPKFISNYAVPGFYYFYTNLSDYVNKNIIIEYFNNEKKLREASKLDIEKQRLEFYNKEDYFLSSVYDKISEDKFIIDIINKAPLDLILRDYITFYLDKYHSDISQSDINNKLIELLLKLRFNEEKNQIIKNNQKEPIKIFLIKIMWIESNVNYISNIIKIFSVGSELFNDANKLYNLMEEIIYNESKSIKYITNEKRNPEYTREVNECYYIILASLCLSVTSEEIKLTDTFNMDNNDVEIERYCNILEEMNNILQNLNNDLEIYLNEMYIIDELKEIIKFKKLKGINIETIEEIRDYLREGTFIIQKSQFDKINELIVNFNKIYDLLILKDIKSEENNDYYYNKYYDTLKYLFFKEINKISDINYRCKILEKILLEKEIIKKSNDIFQILLKKYVSVKVGEKEFKKNLSYIIQSGDEIINLIENNLKNNQEDNYFALSETLLYFFEKNSFIYLNNALYDLKEPILLENEPYEIFKDCINYLQKFINNQQNNEEKKDIKNIAKLFCLGYIKVYCFTFIKMFDEPDPKFKETEKIIEIINKNQIKMIKLYIYKILFNQNKIDVFLNPNSIQKYKLEKYEGFNDFIKFQEEEQINYGQEIDNENYKNIYEVMEKYRKERFKKQIQKDEIDIENLNIDNFYNVSYNLILSHLKRKDFEKSEIYDNFYKNVCKLLFGKDKLSNIIQFFFNPKEYEKIQKDFGINSDNIEAILYGYRYCLNEISDENEDGIYSPLYDIKNINNYLAKKCYPGSDTKDISYYELYSKIINHLKEKSNEGCYVCMCNKGFYHSVSSGFPDYQERNIKCPNCLKDIGAVYKENELEKKLEIVKRDNYFRIFKDNEEVENLKKKKDKRDKLEEINYMTLKEFREKYIQELFNKEKGLPIIDKNYFKKDNKIIRNLSQISYRLLNYILYSHLFFARILTKTNRFDNYLPKGMNWGETLNECWILLKNELLKEGINTIDIFMNFAFTKLFNKLHDKECIENYDDLIDFENDLEKIIQNIVKLSQEESKNYKKLMNEDNEDKNSSINLLKEKYDCQNYSKEEYPFYEYFYYCDYLDEQYISEKLSHMSEFKYPILKKYIENKNNNKDDNNNDDYYSLNNLILFNTVLNLFSEKYSHKITRDYAEKKILKDDEIYNKSRNKKLIDEFIQFYNKLKIEVNKEIDNKDSENIKDIEEIINTKDNKDIKDKEDKEENIEKEIIELNIEKNHLCDFVLDEDNKIGKTYKDIYQKFIKKQNDEVGNLFDIKIISGAFNSNCLNKTNVQQIRKEEIFTFQMPKKFSFINILFDSSYRKIIDNKNYEIYNQYEINFDSIEETMTNLLLKNKKLLNEKINEFNYNNEVFNNEVNDIISSFKEKYITTAISLDDKVVIYNFIKDNENNKILYKKVINDFLTLLQYLNDLKNEYKEDNEDKIENISEKAISEVLENLKNNLSEEFLSIFKEKNDLTINKTCEILEYYLKLIYKYVKDELKDYQEDIDEKELEEKKSNLEKYYENEQSISKDDFENAIRLFMTLILFREEDKENKIKTNRKNIVNYLKAKDFWDKNKYVEEKLGNNLNELKLINIQINQILYLFDIKEEDISDVKENIENKSKPNVIEYNIDVKEEDSASDSESNESYNQSEDEEELERD